jgi:hypothetical protein
MAFAVFPPVGVGPGNALHGLRGLYLTRDRRGAKVARIDSVMELKWDRDAPVFNRNRRQDFSVRWSGSVVPPVSGRYEFSVEASGPMQLWIDGERLLSRERGNDRERAELTLAAGKRHDLLIEYRNTGGGGGDFKLFWQGPDFGRQIIPSTALFPLRGEAVHREQTDTPEAEGPDGRMHPADVARAPGDSLRLKVGGRPLRGAYAVSGSDLLEELAQDTLDAGGRLVFTVQPDPRESLMDPVAAPAPGWAGRSVTFLEARSTEDVARALAGQRFGREISRWLLLAGALLALAEVLLTRWIATQRQAEGTRAEFDDASLAGLARRS